MVAGAIERKAGKGAHLDTGFDQVLRHGLVGGIVPEAGNEMHAAWRNFGHKHIPKLPFQSLRKMIPARPIYPPHSAHMRQKMPIGYKIRKRLLDMGRGDQSHVPLRDFHRPRKRRRDHNISEANVRRHRF